MVIAAKDLHMSIKRGETSAIVASKYGITVDELYSYIREKMHAGSKSLIRDLEKNEKIHSKSCSRRIENSQVTETQDNLDKVIEDNPIVDDFQENDEKTELSREERLSNLLNDESELSQDLCALECKHEEMAERRRIILQQAKECNERLVSLQQALLSEEAKVEEFIDEYEKLASDMLSNTSERRVYEELLADVRQEIEELKHVYLLIKEDCSIECNNSEILSAISSEDETAELTALMNIPEAEDYTLKQLKNIARVRIIKRLYSNIEVTCELPVVSELL